MNAADKVYLLWFRGNHGTYLFGVYETRTAALEARSRYEKSGKCGPFAGYFQDIQEVAVGEDLARGYLP